MALNWDQSKTVLLVGGRSQEHLFLCSLGNLLEKKKQKLILCDGCSFQRMFRYLLEKGDFSFTSAHSSHLHQHVSQILNQIC